MGQSIEAPWIKRTAHTSKWYRPSAGKQNKVAVVHCTAATNPASSTANYFASSAPSGSTQGACDDNEGYDCVPEDAVCAGAPPMNTTGLHSEQAGLSTWSRTEWLNHMNQISRLAYKVAGWCKKYDIPVKLLHANDLPANPADAKGITYHGAVSNRYHQSSHTDPGPNYPWDVFMEAVRGYSANEPMPPKPTPEEEADTMFADGYAYRRDHPNQPMPTGKGEAFQSGWYCFNRIARLEKIEGVGPGAEEGKKKS